jgi:hypothetical protein
MSRHSGTEGDSPEKREVACREEGMWGIVPADMGRIGDGPEIVGYKGGGVE